ncbi:MAG: hypothetical protein NVS4B2_34190 [Chloroflexota bacterium]
MRLLDAGAAQSETRQATVQNVPGVMHLGVAHNHNLGNLGRSTNGL